MKQVILTFSALFSFVLAQNYVAQPYYGDNAIRFLDKETGALHHTLNLDSDAGTYLGGGAGISGPNCVAVFGSKLFVSFDRNANSGVLIYEHNDIYPARNANPPQAISTNSGVAALTHDAAGNLYVARFNNGGSSGNITRYDAPAYASSAVFPVPNWWINYYAGVTVDAAGNVWASNLDGHQLICYTAASGYNDYYLITNSGGHTATATNGTTISVNLFSAPEGLTFDNAGNLWVGNNNDWVRTNNAGEGTLAKISASAITNLLAQPRSGSIDGNVGATYSFAPADANVYYVPNGKLGGLEFDGNRLFVNDQGQNQGSNWMTDGTVWKWDVTTPFNAANFTASTIHTTYPGYGGMAMSTMGFSLPLEWGKVSAKQEGNHILLNWETLKEVNTAHFVVERSSDNQNFEAVGQEKARGAAFNQYTFQDQPQQNGVQYYRIKQVDLDGKYSYSPRMETIFNPQLLFSLYPNPTSDALYFSQKIQGEVTLRNTSGEVLQTLFSPEKLETQKLPTGIYFLQIGKVQYSFVKE